MSGAERTRAKLRDDGAALPAGLAVNDAVRADAWNAELVKAKADIEGKLAAGANGGTPSPLFTMTAADLLARTFDGARWLVTGLITRGGIAAIGAEPKAAKTWLALELALAIATDSPACGEFTVAAGRVVYFFAEDLAESIRNRTRALMAGANRSQGAERLHLEPRGAFIDLLNVDDLARIIASCRRLGVIELLVFDPLRDVHGGQEDSSDEMRDVMRRLRVLAELLGCAVLVVHHAPKATKDTANRRPGQNLRGSSAIHGAIDSGIYLTKPDGAGANVFTSRVTSQVKGARSAAVFELRLDVTDDSGGAAVRAVWTYAKGESKSAAPTVKPATSADELRAAQDAEDDAKVTGWIAAHPNATQSEARDSFREIGAPHVPQKRVIASYKRLQEARQATIPRQALAPAPEALEATANYARGKDEATAASVAPELRQARQGPFIEGPARLDGLPRAPDERRPGGAP